MIGYKYIDAVFKNQKGEEICAHVFLFDDSFVHGDILRAVNPDCNFSYESQGYVSAGSIRLNKLGYHSQGQSVSLGVPGSMDAGVYLYQKAITEGLEFKMFGRNLIVATKGFFKMDRGFKGGTITVTEDRSHPEVALTLMASVVVYHRVNQEETLRINRLVERVLNCGNID